MLISLRPRLRAIIENSEAIVPFLLQFPRKSGWHKNLQGIELNNKSSLLHSDCSREKSKKILGDKFWRTESKNRECWWSRTKIDGYHRKFQSNRGIFIMEVFSAIPEKLGDQNLWKKSCSRRDSEYIRKRNPKTIRQIIFEIFDFKNLSI